MKSTLKSIRAHYNTLHNTAHWGLRRLLQCMCLQCALFSMCRTHTENGNKLRHIEMCVNVPPIFFQCASCTLRTGHIGGTLEKAAESPMCCNVQCVIMCFNAFQCVFQCVSPNVRQCAFNVFSMCWPQSGLYLSVGLGS